MGRFWNTVLGIGLCMCLFLGRTAAHAWEFDMHAHMFWHYEWYGQKGSRGFFGPYNVDNGAGTLAGISIFGTEGSSTPTSARVPRQAGRSLRWNSSLPFASTRRLG